MSWQGQVTAVTNTAVTEALEHGPGLPTVRTKTQFRALQNSPDRAGWNSIAHMLAKRNQANAALVRVRLESSVKNLRMNDDEIYTMLHDLIFPSKGKAKAKKAAAAAAACCAGGGEGAGGAGGGAGESKAGSTDMQGSTSGGGRAQDRAADIRGLLEDDAAGITTMLDVGCAEGSIPATLGGVLGLDAANVHGCDVRAVETRPGFTFKLYSGTRLPYEDGSMDLVTSLMALHHMEVRARVSNDAMCVKCV